MKLRIIAITSRSVVVGVEHQESGERKGEGKDDREDEDVEGRRREGVEDNSRDRGGGFCSSSAVAVFFFFVFAWKCEENCCDGEGNQQYGF